MLLRARTAGAACFAFAIMTLSGAAGSAAGAESEARLAIFEFTLGSGLFTIDLPAGSERSVPRAASISFLTTPGHRVARSISLSLTPMAVAGDRSLTLGNGAHVTYSVNELAGDVGSGGQEAELTGRVELSGWTLTLHCSDQSEFGPRPEWCLRYVETLAVRRVGG